MIRIGNTNNPEDIALSNTKYGRVYKGDSLYWRKINRATYDLTVVGGSGSGTYRKNEIVPIVASVPEGYEFTEWTGDTQWITDLESSNTTITMPAANISIEATYEDTIDWTYEGVMTVGIRGDNIGYDTRGTPMGGMTPDLEGDVSSLYYAGNLGNYVTFLIGKDRQLILSVGSEVVLYVNGNVFTTIVGETITANFNIPNPFPAVGQTCEIKLRYTLAEPEPEPTYPEVTIGTQTWMSVNLDVDDGLGGIYAYNNDEANVATYGRLYTWDAAMRVAASIDGWHLPSREEFQTLFGYLGGFDIGGKLKETGTTHWNSPNTGATNVSGFTALPTGTYNNGGFYDIRDYGRIWSATNYNSSRVHILLLSFNGAGILMTTSPKILGFAVRLIRD